MRTRPWGWLCQTDKRTPTLTAKERPPHFHLPMIIQQLGRKGKDKSRVMAPKAPLLPALPREQQAPLWDQAHLHEEARQVLSEVNTEGSDPSQTTDHSGSDRLPEPLRGHWFRTADGVCHLPEAGHRPDSG